MTLYIRKSDTTGQQVPPHGSKFRVKNDTVAYWTVWHYLYQPSYFEQYNLSITKPPSESWNLSRVFDPRFQNQTDAVITATGANTTHVLLPYTIISDFGWWNFTFSSTNIIESVTGVQSTYYISPRNPSQLSVSVTHTKNAGETNLTLYRSDGSVAAENTTTFSGTTTVGFSIDFNSGEIYTAGQYTLCLSYDNGVTPTQTQAGFYSSQFDIIHDTTLDVETSPILVTYGAGFFYPRVAYVDTRRSNAFIANTSGTVRVNGTVDGNFIVFEQAGSLYQAIIANDLLAPGDYNLSVQANDRYYEYATTNISIQVRSDATLTSPESPGVTLPYDESTTVQVFYEDELGVGIAGAMVTTDWPTNPMGIGNGSSGWYNITIDTSVQPAPSTYSLTINATKTNYQTRLLVLTVVVRKIATSITYSTPGSVPYGENVTIPFNYTVNDPESQYDSLGIGSVQKSDLTLTLGGSVLGSSEFTFTSGAQAGMYNITILFSSGKINSIKSYKA